jgi:hypothetical protein
MTLEWTAWLPIIIAIISETLPFLNGDENGLLHGLVLGLLRTLKNVDTDPKPIPFSTHTT